MQPRVTSAATAEDRAIASGGISGGVVHYEWTVRGLQEEIRASEAILDLGCGVGLFGTYLNERFGKKPHGIDVVRHEGFRDGDHASFELRNLETLEDSGRQYDLIFAIGLLEYLPNPRALVRTLPAALRAGGRAVITAPNPASLRSIVALWRRGEYSAFREDSNPASISPVLPVDACRMFREAGFRDVAIDYSGRGRPPLMHGAQYQEVLPFLRGRLWSDDFRVIATKQ
jgi:SAM-dependent methyltransferase